MPHYHALQFIENKLSYLAQERSFFLKVFFQFSLSPLCKKGHDSKHFSIKNENQIQYLNLILTHQKPQTYAPKMLCTESKK